MDRGGPQQADQLVTQVVADSRSWRAVAAVHALLQRAWRHSAARRAGLALAPGGGAQATRTAAWTAAWAALTALWLPLAGSHRDGPGWIVPAAVLLLAMVVLLLAPAPESPGRGE